MWIIYTIYALIKTLNNYHNKKGLLCKRQFADIYSGERIDLLFKYIFYYFM